jgi:YesN/AraC family two-component response regulator
VALELLLLLILQQVSALLDLKTKWMRPELRWRGKRNSSFARNFIYRFPLRTLARALHCNADYLGRVFRRTFHLTLTEAIHRQRVRAAEKLLLNDSASLTEVAARCGFNDVGYFRQIFTKHTG